MIFVDTSFWIAQLLPRDGHHRAARQLEAQHSAAPLVTSSAVLGETWTYVRRRADHALAFRWLDRVRGELEVRVERIEEGLHGEAWEWLRAHDERPYSFVDATSFALMRRLRIREALAFDGDFGAAGFIELRPA